VAGAPTWQNCIAQIQARELGVFGRWVSRWRVIRTSNAYVFRDPQPQLAGVPASKSENPTGTQDQDVSTYWSQVPIDPDSPLERALRQLGGVIEERMLMNKAANSVVTP